MAGRRSGGRDSWGAHAAAGARAVRNSSASPPSAVARHRSVARTAHSPTCMRSRVRRGASAHCLVKRRRRRRLLTARVRRSVCSEDVGGSEASSVSRYLKPHIGQYENPRSPTLTARQRRRHSRCTNRMLPAQRHGAKRSASSFS